jgi:hypothetical protein
MMTKVSAITEALHPLLVDAGYVCLDECVYKAISSGRQVEHFIYFFKDHKRPDMLWGDFGIRNELAEAFGCNVIRAYGGELFKFFKCGEPTSCTMRFSFARLELSGWPLPLSSLSGNQLRNRVRDFMTEHLAPTIGQVNTLEEFLSLLTTDTSYCPWLRSNGAIRAAQIVASAGQMGLDAASIRAMLEPRKQLIAQGVSRTSEMRADPTAYINRILNDWAAGYHRSV